MNRTRSFWTWVALVLVVGPLAAWLGAGAAAQSNGAIAGEVRDQEGKPFAGVTLILKHTESGQTFELKTDDKGRFRKIGLRSGPYVISVKFKEQIVWEGPPVVVSSGNEATANINFKDIKGAAALEAVKKQEEEKKKFESLKAHFDGGTAALEQARAVRGEMLRSPAEQRGPMQQKLNDLYGTAISELQAAEKATGENDANRHLVLAKLGEAYLAAGRYP